MVVLLIRGLSRTIGLPGWARRDLDLVSEARLNVEHMENRVFTGGEVATRPSTVELTDVADRGEVMPPKTTYFDPKPCAGIFLLSATHS